MFIEGIIAILIEQGLLNDLANIDYVELVVAPNLVFSFTTNFITSGKLN